MGYKELLVASIIKWETRDKTMYSLSCHTKGRGLYPISNGDEIKGFKGEAICQMYVCGNNLLWQNVDRYKEASIKDEASS